MEPIHFRRDFVPVKTCSRGATGAKRTRPIMGFTLVEMLVVLAIIIVITGLVFSSQSSFNKSLVLANTAYDVALTLHSAQTYGPGSRSSAAGMANVGYGVDFQSATPSVFTFFSDSYPSLGFTGLFCHQPITGTPSDRPGNCAYEANQNEKVVSYTMNNQITVGDFCAYTSIGIPLCSVAHGGGLSSLDIVFARPNPSQPFISTNGLYSAAWTKACLTIASSQGASRSVTVTASGEITTSATPCP